jgi:hypothetical protein
MNALEIPESYRITEADNHQAWTVFGDRQKYLALSREEECVIDAFVDAGEIKQATGEWPTLGEIYAKWTQAKAEREHRRLASWLPNYRFSKKDLADYEEFLALEKSGPFMTFMGVVAHLKESTGTFPTVGEVRTHCANQQEA